MRFGYVFVVGADAEKASVRLGHPCAHALRRLLSESVSLQSIIRGRVQEFWYTYIWSLKGIDFLAEGLAVDLGRDDSFELLVINFEQDRAVDCD